MLSWRIINLTLKVCLHSYTSVQNIDVAATLVSLNSQISATDCSNHTHALAERVQSRMAKGPLWALILSEFFRIRLIVM